MKQIFSIIKHQCSVVFNRIVRGKCQVISLETEEGTVGYIEIYSYYYALKFNYNSRKNLQCSPETNVQYT
jgi:hypothetical protein